MLVGNWMAPEPKTVTSDTLVADAQRIVSESELRILCVVDEGRLRGVLTRKNLSEAANCVASTQNIHEVDYFVKRLKVKDLMNRMVKTADVRETVEQIMLRGQRESVSTFPVLDQGRLVGLVSEVEIFNAMLEVLGARENMKGLTLEPMEIEPGLLGRISAIAEGAGANLEAIFTVRVNGNPRLKKIVLRFEVDDVRRVADALRRVGYRILEAESDAQACQVDPVSEDVKC